MVKTTKKISSSKLNKVKKILFKKPVAIVKPYIPEKEYKLPQVYVPRVVENRPLEEKDENMYAGELDYYDDLPDIDDKQIRLMHEYEFGTPQRRNRYFCRECCSCVNSDSVCRFWFYNSYWRCRVLKLL
ncbi:uncharacterized protein LOC124811380 [Hydra vulgaris]|uniref:uncharacterized protein LOC124811380 n=1 Tax=Hydra vulgaris TaxID=6087 RepID=UPI0032EA0E9D